MFHTNAAFSGLTKIATCAKQRPTPFLSSDRRLEGEEIAPGLRYLEYWQACRQAPERLRLAALRHEEVATDQVLAFDTEEKLPVGNGRAGIARGRARGRFNGE